MSVYENPKSFRFAVALDVDEIESGVRMVVVKTCHGVVKIVVQIIGGEEESAVY